MLAIGGGAVPTKIQEKSKYGSLKNEGRYEVITDALVRSVAFSPDGSSVASVDATGVVYLWNAATGDLEWKSKFADKAGGNATLEFSPDGQMLVTIRNTYSGILGHFHG